MQMTLFGSADIRKHCRHSESNMEGEKAEFYEFYLNWEENKNIEINKGKGKQLQS